MQLLQQLSSANLLETGLVLMVDMSLLQTFILGAIFIEVCSISEKPAAYPYALLVFYIFSTFLLLYSEKKDRRKASKIELQNATEHAHSVRRQVQEGILNLLPDSTRIGRKLHTAEVCIDLNQEHRTAVVRCFAKSSFSSTGFFRSFSFEEFISVEPRTLSAHLVREFYADFNKEYL